MQQSRKISVVIPAFNAAETILACVDSINITVTPHEIIVVDDASTDITRHRVEDAYSSEQADKGCSELNKPRACLRTQ